MRQPAPRPDIAQLRRGRASPAWPEPGFFKLRLVKNGPFIPALIWYPCPMVLPSFEEEAEPPGYWCLPTDPWRGPRWLRARIGDDEVDPLDLWVRGPKERIDEPEYLWLMHDQAWARAYAPDDPVAQPRQPVDLSKRPSLF